MLLFSSTSIICPALKSLSHVRHMCVFYWNQQLVTQHDQNLVTLTQGENMHIKDQKSPTIKKKKSQYRKTVLIKETPPDIF